MSPSLVLLSILGKGLVLLLVNMHLLINEWFVYRRSFLFRCQGVLTMF